MAREGWSMREIVRRADRAGHDVSPSRMSQIMTEDIKLFGPKNIAVLVDALDEPPEVVIRAYIEAIGYELPRSQRFTIEDSVKYDEVLSQDDKANLLALVRSMRRRAKARTASLKDEQPVTDLPNESVTEDTQQEHARPSSPTSVVRGVAKTPGVADESVAEDSDVPTVARPDGAVADVEDSLCEAPGGHGEANSQ
jgi:hypothetical protein